MTCSISSARIPSCSAGGETNIEEGEIDKCCQLALVTWCPLAAIKVRLLNLGNDVYCVPFVSFQSWRRSYTLPCCQLWAVTDTQSGFVWLALMNHRKFRFNGIDAGSRMIQLTSSLDASEWSCGIRVLSWVRVVSKQSDVIGYNFEVRRKLLGDVVHSGRSLLIVIHREEQL